MLDVVAENAARVCATQRRCCHLPHLRADSLQPGRPLRAMILWQAVKRVQPISRGLPAGRRRRRPTDDSSYTIWRQRSETEFPEGLSFQKRGWTSHHTGHAVAARRNSHRDYHDSPDRSSTFPRKADHTTQRPSPTRPSSPSRTCGLFQELRRAQRRIARGPGASDGNGRGARHHQPLADGRAAGARRHRRERGAGLWD